MQQFLLLLCGILLRFCNYHLLRAILSSDIQFLEVCICYGMWELAQIRVVSITRRVKLTLFSSVFV